MTKCRPVQKEKCVKVPREVIVQKEQKQCLPYEISQAEIDIQANVDPCLSQGFDVGAQAVLAQPTGSYEYTFNYSSSKYFDLMIFIEILYNVPFL